MGYWKEVRDVLGKGVHLAAEGVKEGTDQAIGGIKEGAEGVKEGAENIVEKTKDSITLAQLKKDLKSQQEGYDEAVAAFGDAVYDIYMKKMDIYKDGIIETEALLVSDKEKDCRKIEKEIKKIEKKK
ncbi:MAG: hypothetical protein PF693_17150 [Spirochaetia bacterium]|jgi:hypothetical protein|nr:hypothetical protein [Spirochaetia bacterium]